MIDPAMPQLAELQDRAGMARRLAEVLGDASISVTSVDLVRHKPGRRAILRYQLKRQSGADILFAKTFASDRGPRVFAVTKAIVAAHAFGPDIALPEPVAYLPEVKLIVQRAVPGEPFDAALLAACPELLPRIAEAIHNLHASDIDLGRRHDLNKELEPLPRRAEQVCAEAPELASPVDQCVRGMEELRHRTWPWRYRPVHRDFYDAQVLVDGGRLAVLDLDDAAMSEPAVDIANFAAHLLLMGLTAGDDRSVGVSAFLNQSFRLDSDLDRDLVHFLIATTLLRLAGIHVARPNGPTLARGLLAACVGALNRI